MILNHRDLVCRRRADERRPTGFAELRGLWQTLRDRNPCHIVQVGFDAPPGGSWASLENMLPEGRRRLTRAINWRLAEDLPPGVSLVDANEVAAEVGPEYWSDAEWHSAKQYPVLGGVAAAGRPFVSPIARRRWAWAPRCWR